MERVLQVFGEPLASGGQEAFIMNIYRNIDKEKVQFDFFTPFSCTNEALRAEIEALGGRVFEAGGRFLNEGDKGDFVNNLTAFLDKNKYGTVHIHSGSIFSLSFGAKIARLSGAKKVLVHSHATGNNNLKYKVIKFLSRGIFEKHATHYCACSKSAAAWKFPKKVIRDNRYHVIDCGIDIDRFTFSKDTREKYRKELGIEDNFVICHIGRFSAEKNHAFLIDTFAAVKSLCENAKLMLIGEGPEMQAARDKVLALGLEKDIMFMGVRSDVSELLQASDVFVFPSVFEGLGIVAIEAQSTGLKTICSEHIPSEVDMTDLFCRVPLTDGVNAWAKEILSTKSVAREKYSDILREKKYTAKNAADRLMELYLEN